ncbi:MAG: hypothetical protein RL380_131 [Verrucomicrobiota bacterium]|jgi:hypothetical protein
MSAAPDEFEKLRKLLALKKHEVPPPGYFDHLAGDVRARLRGGEHLKSDLWEQMGEEASWMQRFWGALAAKPALATVCGVGVCAVALGGIFVLQENTANNDFVMVRPQTFVTLPPQNSSTNPAVALPNGSSLFDQLPNQQVAPVNFAPSSQ